MTSFSQSSSTRWKCSSIQFLNNCVGLLTPFVAWRFAEAIRQFAANGSEMLRTLCTCRNISKMHHPGQESQGPLWSRDPWIHTPTCTEEISMNSANNLPVVKLPTMWSSLA